MTTRYDMFGSPVTLNGQEALEAWNATQLGFLSHAAATPDHLQKTRASDPDFALALVCKGLFSLLLARRELAQVALDAEREARLCVQKRPITAREMQMLAALSDWNGGKPSVAADRLDGLVAEDPHDALAMKLVQSIRFVLGDGAGMRQSIEQVVPVLNPECPAFGYALGCHAFTLEETGEFSRAERIGREGVIHSPDDAWGLHAVAHVYDMTNDTNTGLEWLSNRTDAWSHCNNFRYHVWWHMALMHLDRREIDAVFALYDDKIRHDKTDDYRDISNAASLLSRLELDGISVGDRWQELAQLAESRLGDACLAFADLHYALSLIGGGRNEALSAMLARMRQCASTPHDDMASVMRCPGLDTAEGLEAFSEGNFQQAFHHLAGCRLKMPRIGGSHAQRDVFERLTVEAAIRSGNCEAAQTILEQRTRLRGGNPDRFASERMEIVTHQMLAARSGLDFDREAVQLMPAQ